MLGKFRSGHQKWVPLVEIFEAVPIFVPFAAGQSRSKPVNAGQSWSKLINAGQRWSTVAEFWKIAFPTYFRCSGHVYNLRFTIWNLEG
uniref:Uncharacterized protein n=1 Tax=Ficus carica TaxID=3494 RepID=A0AA88CWK4_FICCA|nr:hypothetical protein TIFTF001_050024 [Ficus carica]